MSITDVGWVLPLQRLDDLLGTVGGSSRTDDRQLRTELGPKVSQDGQVLQ